MWVAEVRPKWSEARKDRQCYVTAFSALETHSSSAQGAYCVLTFSNTDKEIVKKMMTFASCDHSQNLRSDLHCSKSVLLNPHTLSLRVPWFHALSQRKPHTTDQCPLTVLCFDSGIFFLGSSPCALLALERLGSSVGPCCVGHPWQMGSAA